MFQRKRKSSRNGTCTAFPPAAWIIAMVGGHSGSGTITSSPGSSNAWNTAYNPCVPPLVTRISSSDSTGMWFLVRIFSANALRSGGMPAVGR